MYDDFSKYLSKALSSDLPGDKAHVKLVPPGRALKATAQDLKRVKDSGVLFLLFPKDGELVTCLIKRPVNMTHHPGQIGFPGGKIEEQDLTTEDAAKREAFEEVGIAPNNYEIIGKISDLYVAVSNFMIHPYLAWTNEEPKFVINRNEVQKIVYFPLIKYIGHKLETKEMDTSIGRINVPYYPFQNEIIWGATAMIISEFLEIIKDYYPLFQE